MIDGMYQVQRQAISRFIPLRHLQYHVREWGSPNTHQPTLFMDGCGRIVSIRH